MGRHLVVQTTYRADGRFKGAEKMTLEGPVFDRYDVEIHGHHAIAIAGADPSEPPLMETLRLLQLRVSETIEAFKPEF